MFKVRKGRDCLQFNTVCQLQAEVSGIYSETPTAHASGYSLKSHNVSVLYMHEGAMQLAFMERLSKSTNRRIIEDSYQNKPVNPLLVNYILNHIEHKLVMTNIEPFRKRGLLMTTDYISVMYG